MATYGQLLIGSGGGVIDHNKQSERQEGATLIIGLGGTGGRAVQMIKKEVYRQLRPDDKEAVIPEYKNIRYLIVDTDNSDYSKPTSNPADIDSKREFYDISYNAIEIDFKKDNYPILEKNKAMSPWLNYKKINPQTAKAGAGGVRQVGRYLLVKNAFDYYNRIKTEISVGMKESRSNDLNIHICAGISGGTGSGTFLDTCYLVRKAIDELGISGAQICGYFFLPDVNLNVPAVIQDTSIAAFIKVNGYAAMQELDYCMNFDKNNSSFKMDYGAGIEVDDSRRPVDLCYLISATDSSGKVLKNGYSYAMNVVTDHVISFLSKVTLPDGVTTTNNEGLTIQGHIANIDKKISTLKLMTGTEIHYNLLGASVAEMPLSEIATYLGVKLFENIEGIYKKVPTKQERDGFVTMLRLQYDNVFSDIMKDCNTEVPFSKKHDGSLLQERGTGIFTDLYNKEYDLSCGKVERNAKTMMQELSTYRINGEGEGTSLISRVFKELYERCVINIDYGPFYAKRMLYGQDNEDIYKAVLGLIETNHQRIETEQLQERTLLDEMNIAKAKAENVNIINRGERADKLKNAYNNYYIHMCKLMAYDKLDKVLTTFRDQIAELDRKLFNVLTTMMETLRATFEENAKIYSEGIQDKTSYTWKILDIKDVASQLDATIQSMNVKMVLINMMNHMFDKVDVWTKQSDDNEICKMISDFILGEFKSATEKTMTDYLRKKYNATDIKTLSKEIDNDIMQNQLWDRSTPLFWKSPAYNETIGFLNTLSIPFDSQEIELAANETMVPTQGATLRKTGITDKISLMRFLSGIPMYAYAGLEELERAYEMDTSYGRHLYEVGDNNWNEILPSPVPLSRENGKNERQYKKNTEIKEIWNRAKEKKIIVSDDRDLWSIMLTKGIDIDALEEEYKGIEKGNIDALNDFNNKINSVNDNLEATQEKFDIKIESVAPSYEEQVSLDIFARAPKIITMVKAEFSLRERLLKLTEEAKKKQVVAKAILLQKDEFFNAVFTGVIMHDQLIVKYIDDNYGMKEEKILASPEMAYGKSATYQAFINYLELSDELKEKISAESNAALTSSDDEIIKRKQEAINFIDSKLVMLMNTAYINQPSIGDIKNEVTEFYKDFLKAYQNFKMFN